MSVFSDLLTRARTAGARSLVFEVNLADYAAARPDAWLCARQDAGPDDPGNPAVRGQSGEEALRRLVDALESR